MMTSPSSGSGSSSSSSSRLMTMMPSHHHHHQPPAQPAAQQQPSRYESQKRRDWNTFGQYLKNQRPAMTLSECKYTHVLEFMRYLDQFGKTKVHSPVCAYFGQPDPAGPCACPLRQAWGSLDALVGRLRAAYDENGGLPETNPFAAGAIRVYLREVRDSQAKARGIPYKKKKKKIIKKSNSNSHDSNSNNNGVMVIKGEDQDQAATPSFQMQ